LSTNPASIPPAATAYRDAAVIVPVFRDPAGDGRLAVIRRAERGRHGGQLAFPGGTREPHDATLVETALREAREEVGLAREAIEILEQLPVLETRTSGYRIHPFLARIRRPAAWVLSADEVAEMLEPRLADLALPESHGEADWQLPSWDRPYRVAFYRVGEHRLWGLSYRILHPILPRLADGSLF
jgi:8-oxo-dGTP pyrophosphatase MutT (NUDIX family)